GDRRAVPHARAPPRQAERARVRRGSGRSARPGPRRACSADRGDDARERGADLRRPVTLTITQIRELLAAHGIRPSKALGQHFLADPNTAERIVRLAGVRPGDRVVEVGPGAGSLTVAWLDAGAHVRAVELDRHLLPVLEEVTAGRDIEIVAADALRVDWP